MEIRVALADHHPMVTNGVLSALRPFPMISVTDVASNPTELMRILDRIRCDVLVTESGLPGGGTDDEGELLRRIRERHPGLKIVLHTMLETPALIGNAIAFGISSLVSKRDTPGNIIAGILAAHSGGRFLSPSILMATSRIASDNIAWRKSRLSRCELDVLQLYTRGMSVSEIAAHLNRSIKTISGQKCNAMRKLRLKPTGTLDQPTLASHP